MRAWDIDFDTDLSDVLLDEKNVKKKAIIFYFMTFHIKLEPVQTYCVLGTVK